MALLLINANSLHIPLADGVVQTCVTSPPYWGLRAYDGEQCQIWGGDPECDHKWINRRYYTERGAGKSSGDAWEGPGAANAERVKMARWRNDSTCGVCGAWYGALGLEPSPELYVEHLVAIFREVRRVLRDDGVLWLNLGDSYNGSGGAGGWNIDRSGATDNPNRGYKGLKSKDLVGIPWMVAFALRADGWYLRSDIIWHKPNPMPESVQDRPTKSHEYVFLLSKSASYYYDADSIREENSPNSGKWGKSVPSKTGQAQGDGRHGASSFLSSEITHAETIERYYTNGRNKRSVWTIATAPYPGQHFATFPPALVEPCIKAGSSEAGCCSRCGKAWERITEKTGERITTHWAPGTDRKTEAAKGRHGSTSVLTTGYQFVYRDLGFTPACACRDLVPCTGDHAFADCLQCDNTGLMPVIPPARPCIVLDPFCGSGTTGLVARQLGRHFVGLDLSYAYLHDQARARLSLDALDEWQNGRQVEATALDGLPLFE